MNLMEFLDPFGNVPGSSLNWSQHAALERAARRTSTAPPTALMIDTTRIESELQSVGATTSQVIKSVESLEAELGLQLEAQTEALVRQAELLDEISKTLHSPAHTRAAEQLRDATELLRNRRYERALASALQAIENDPNNDAAFVAAGWACRGLEQGSEAREYFREAAQATTFARAEDVAALERHIHSLLLAARVTFALDGASAAISELASLDPHRYPSRVSAAVRFDRAIYLAADQRSDAAIENFRQSSNEDGRFCLMALTDPVIAANDKVYAAVVEELHERRRIIDDIYRMLHLGEERLRLLRTKLHRYALTGDPKVQAWLDHQTAAALNPNSHYRARVLEKELQEAGRSRLQQEYLTQGEGAIKTYLHGFEEAIDPLIRNEVSREEALSEAISRELGMGGTRLLQRGRVEAVFGRRGIRTTFRCDFWKISIGLDRREKVVALQKIKKLKDDFREANS